MGQIVTKNQQKKTRKISSFFCGATVKLKMSRNPASHSLVGVGGSLTVVRSLEDGLVKLVLLVALLTG